MEKEQLLEYVKSQGIKFIRLQVTDINGMLKNVEVPSSRLEQVIKDGTMFDGSSIEGLARIDESDMILKPDLNTFTILPWTVERGKVGRLICDVYTTTGKPFEGDSRYILKKVVKKLEEKGYTGYCGPEPEFFLLPKDEKNKQIKLEFLDEGGYFDLLPVDLGEETRKSIVNALQVMGLKVEASHHEVAPSQHEIDFQYDDLISTADNIQTFKLVVKTMALIRGLHATFMPKPFPMVNGSGMHANTSLFKEDKNIFFNKDGDYQLSQELRYFVGGVIKHIPAITAIANPTINSYKRLIPGYEAPVNVAWSVSNRSALIRVPAARGKGTRAELRSPDPISNPYLLLAVIFGCGLKGIEEKITPPDPVIEDIYSMDNNRKIDLGIGKLPGSLKESLNELKRDNFVREIIGEHIYKTFISIKEKEIECFKVHVTDWEIDQYLKLY
jgi:glutamine synthetase